MRHGGEDERLHLHAYDPALGHVVQERHLVGCRVLADGAVQPTLAIKGDYLRTEGVLTNSVADPDPNPDPPYPRVFGPPGSGSISQRYRSVPGSRSGSLCH